MRKLAIICLLLAATRISWAVPDTVRIQVTDVTTSSFSLVWMTNVAATPAVEIYSDPSLTNRIDDKVVITPMPDAMTEVSESARSKGIMKVRVAGLSPNTSYYARSVTADPLDPLSVGFSPVQQVQTEVASVPFTTASDGSLQAFGNDLVSFKVHIQPNDQSLKPGRGDLLLLETPDSPYPVSSFVGSGTVSSEGIVDLNNLYGSNRQSRYVQGGEKAVLRVYRGGTLSMLLHYRWLPVNSQSVAVKEPLRGFFADYNLDGKVDSSDFEEFRSHFRTAPNDAAYNPDFNVIDDPEGKVDARDFARFAHEYGRVGVK